MPATKVQLSGGAFQDALGNLVANGYLYMQLSQDAQVTGASPEVQITAGRIIKITLDASGNVTPSPAQSVWPNDVLTPANTYYTVSVYTAAGQLVWGPNAQQVLSSPSPYDIGAGWSPARVNIAAPLQQTVYDVGVFYPSTYASSQIMLLLKLDRKVVFASALTPSTAVCGTNPTSNALITLLKNGVQFGTLTVTTGGVCTFASAGTTFNAGDTLEILAPASADATLANVGIILSGLLG